MRMQQNAQPAGFHLRKLYIDCVSPAGLAIIAYSGSVSWKSFSTGISNVTLFDSDGKTRSRWALSCVEERHSGAGLCWDARELACCINMRSRADGFAEQLLHSDFGDVDWNCIVPFAEVAVDLEGTRIEGLGYAELIELTLPPWSLPLDVLRWGRFLGGDESLVWIEWRGAHSMKRAWWNGRCLTTGDIGHNRVALEGNARLEMEEFRVLRSGTLERLFAPVEVLLRMLPVGRIHETRWLSAGRLYDSATEIARGWAIHEEVSFR